MHHARENHAYHSNSQPFDKNLSLNDALPFCTLGAMFGRDPGGRGESAMPTHYMITPVGQVRKDAGRTWIEVAEPYRAGLLGLEQFSHILVLTWFDRNDTPEKRFTLRVHPRGDPTNPLSGVFATRSPVRPNPVGLHSCELLAIRGHRIHVDRIDAFDRTPVIDIKPCLGQADCRVDLRIPAWARK